MTASDDPAFHFYMDRRKLLLSALRAASEEADRLLPDARWDIEVHPEEMAAWWAAVQRETEAHQNLQEYDLEYGADFRPAVAEPG